MLAHPLATSIEVLFILLGIFFLILVAIRPRLFWLLLIIASVGAGGLMIFKNTFIDEYLMYMVILGSILPVVVNQLNLRNEPESRWQQWHKVFFLSFMGYMVMESIRGIIVLESPQKIRWVVMYGMLGFFAWLISKKGLPHLSSRAITRLVSLSGFLYSFAYIAHGIIAEGIRGVSRFSLQPGEWSTSAYALFLAVITVPCALSLLNDSDSRWRWVARASLIAVVAASVYYFSRVALLVIIAFVLMTLRKVGVRRMAVQFFIPLALVVLLVLASNRKFLSIITSASTDVRVTVENLIDKESSTRGDIDRIVHLQAGFASIQESAVRFMVGSGFRTSGIIIGPHLRRLYVQYGFPMLAAKVSNDNESTEAFTAFLVETGLIGMTLLVANVVFAGYGLVHSRHPWRRAFLLSLIFSVLWLPVINMLDVMLFYFMLMPKGLLWQLTKDGRGVEII